MLLRAVLAALYGSHASSRLTVIPMYTEITCECVNVCVCVCVCVCIQCQWLKEDMYIHTYIHYEVYIFSSFSQLNCTTLCTHTLTPTLYVYNLQHVCTYCFYN